MIPQYVEVILLAIVVPVLVQLLKLWQARRGAEISRETVTLIVSILSIVGGAIVFFVSPHEPLPAFEGDVVAMINALLPLASALMALITLFYNMFLKAVFESLGFSVPDGPAG